MHRNSVQDRTLCLTLAGLGLVRTAIAFVAFLELIKEIGPTRAGVITYVTPAVAVAAGAPFPNEDLPSASASPSP
nr:EamA family transporter [Streptomyces violaceorubidus]